MRDLQHSRGRNMAEGIDWVLIASRNPVCSVGQLSKHDLKALEAAVKKGVLVRRKANWAGNFGAVKTFYAASDVVFDAYQADEVAKFDLLHALDQANAACNIVLDGAVNR